MNLDSRTGLHISGWLYAIAAVAGLVVLGSIWWGSGLESIEPQQSAQAAAPKPLPHVPYHGERAVVSAPPIDPLPDLSTSSRPEVTVTVEEPAPPKPKATAIPKPGARAQANPIKDMFPVGPIATGTVTYGHPFRTLPEMFPSFSYAGRLWMFTGRFVTSGNTDLVWTGQRVADRRVFALANTQGPGTALFVQSSQNPAKFAIYR